MKPAEWRTPTVVSLCLAMRESRDYRATPILADALEDIGCDEPDLLSLLRSERPTWEAERLVALVYSDETAEAVHWLEAFANELGEGGFPGGLPAMTYERLLQAAHAFNAGDMEPFEDGSMNWSNASMGHDLAFWTAFQKLTGARLHFEPAEYGAEFFACTC
jgi:hypothetical protein